MREKRKNYGIIITLLLAVMTFVYCCMSPAGAYLSVDSAKCKNCAVCVSVCQSDAVRIVNGKAVIDPTKCVECGRCVEVCPENAIY